MKKTLQQNLNVINALIYRDYRIRFNNSKFSFIGILLNPVGQVIVFLLIYVFIRVRTNPYMDSSLFLTIGIVQYGLFNEIGIRSQNIMNIYTALFNYRLVEPIHLLISRFVVGVALQLLILIIILQSIFFIKGEIIFENIPLFAISFLALSFYSFGIGSILLVLNYKKKFLSEKIVPLLFRPYFLLSGTIFSLYAIPQKFHKYLTWNPLLQANELSRHALTGDYFLFDGISLSYLIISSIAILTIGIILYSLNYKDLNSNDIY